MTDLSRVLEEELRSVWQNEERDFTPWLTENIDKLTEVIGFEVEEVRREESVGGFSADIVAREINTGKPLVVENQYGTTDHDHLGKLLTYSAGIDAGFTIWLAEQFREEHRSVLEWLNETGPRDAKFFGIKPRVISLEGGEQRGFEFEVIVEPNDWERELVDSVSETDKAYREFYANLTAAYAEANPDWYKLTPQPQSWMNFGAGKAGMAFAWAFHKGPEFAVELYIDTGEKEQNEAIYQTLKEDQDEIEMGLTEELIWQQLPDKRACRIKIPNSVSGTITELSENEKQELIYWGVEKMDTLRDQFEHRIKNL